MKAPLLFTPPPLEPSTFTERSEIRGLSLTRPWPFAFVNGPPEIQKRCENRDYPPPPSLIGCYLALHAAKSWDESDREFISEVLGIPVPSNKESPHTEIFAVCRLTGFVEDEDDPRLPENQRQWFIGPYCYLLSDFVALKTPVPTLGHFKFWTFDSKPEVLVALRKAYKESL